LPRSGQPFNPYRKLRGGILPDEIRRHPKLSPQAKIVLAALLRLAGPEGACMPSIKTLSRESAICRSSVFHCLAELEHCGLIRRVSRGEGRSKRFEFLWHESYGAELSPVQSAGRVLVQGSGLPPSEDSAIPVKSRSESSDTPGANPSGVSDTPAQEPERAPVREPGLHPSKVPDTEKSNKKHTHGVSATEDEFEQVFDPWWSIWPRKVARAPAIAAFRKVIIMGEAPVGYRSLLAGDLATPEGRLKRLMTTTPLWNTRDYEHRPPEKTPYPATHINKFLWIEAPEPNRQGTSRRSRDDGYSVPEGARSWN